MEQHYTFPEILLQLEQAIHDQRFDDSVSLLSRVIDAVRAYSHKENTGVVEKRTFGGGLSSGALIDRARILQARCQNCGGDTVVDSIARELLVLLDDLVEVGEHILEPVKAPME